MGDTIARMMEEEDRLVEMVRQKCQEIYGDKTIKVADLMFALAKRREELRENYECCRHRIDEVDHIEDYVLKEESTYHLFKEARLRQGAGGTRPV